MALITTEKCTRCHRDEKVELKDLKEASNLNDLQERRKIAESRIREFLATIPPEELPDFIGVKGEKIIIHGHLCSLGGPKSNCDKRVDVLLTDIDTLDPRKPRTKKTESAATDDTKTE
jgi:hypothetical protein